MLRPARQSLRRKSLQKFIGLVPNESQRVFILTLIVGAACGIAAVLFHLSILWVEGFLIGPAMAASNGHWMWLTILVPTLGGLLSGVLLYYVFPGSRGSGIPQVKAAFEIKGGRLPFIDAAGKFLIGVLQIGSGSSLGREGPTVHICAGVSSALGKVAALSQQNLRRLMPVGVAAGIAAAFNAPIAAVTFTIEEVVGDLDQTVLSGVIVAAAIAAAIERSILGEHPVFTILQNFGPLYASSLILYAALGVAGGIVSLVFSEMLLRLRKWFGALYVVPPWARPGIGAAITGILAVLALYFFQTEGVTGGGYTTLSAALSGSLAFRVMAVLVVLKLIATVFSYSSGGAGGIFAPTLFIGGMLGGVIGYADIFIFDHPSNEVGAFALVGMGAVFAGVIRAPITSVLIIFEMTGSYKLIVPLMIANMTAYTLAKRYRPLPIYEALLEQDGIYLPKRRKQRTHALEKLSVEALMTANPVTIPANVSIGAALETVCKHKFSVFPVTNSEGRCVGLVTQARLERNLAENLTEQTAGDIAGAAAFIYPDNSLAQAIVKMDEAKVIKLCVVDRKSGHRLVGILTMSDIVRAQAQVLSSEQNLEMSAVPGFSEPARQGHVG